MNYFHNKFDSKRNSEAKEQGLQKLPCSSRFSDTLEVNEIASRDFLSGQET